MMINLVFSLHALFAKIIHRFGYFLTDFDTNSILSLTLQRNNSFLCANHQSSFLFCKHVPMINQIDMYISPLDKNLAERRKK